MADADDQVAETGEGEDAADGAEGGKKGSKKKLLLVIVAALLVLGGGAAGAGYFLGWFGAGSGETMTADAEEAVVPPKEAVFYDLPEMTVNLSTAETRAQFLRIVIALELPDRDTISLIEPFMPRVLDAFQTHLRELRMTDLEGSAGLFRLREELARRINLAVHPARVDAVLFKEIIVQ